MTLIDNKIWIIDSGSSCHYCNSEAAFFNYTIISEDITVGKEGWKPEYARFNRKMVENPTRGTSRCKICTRPMGKSVPYKQGSEKWFHILADLRKL